MPAPVSLTASITYWPGGTETCRLAYASSSSTFAVSTVSRPPWGIASRELTTRLTMTCSIWPGSAFTRPRSAAGTTASSTSSPMSRLSMGSMAVITAFRSSTCGCSTCLRLKARSCWVRAAARSAVVRTRVASR